MFLIPIWQADRESRSLRAARLDSGFLQPSNSEAGFRPIMGRFLARHGNEGNNLSHRDRVLFRRRCVMFTLALILHGLAGRGVFGACRGVGRGCGGGGCGLWGWAGVEGEVGLAGGCCAGRGVVTPGRFGWLLVGVGAGLGECVDVLVGLV